MSSDAVAAIERKDKTTWAQNELAGLEWMVEQHKALQQRCAPVLFVNYAQLLWQPDAAAERLATFAPCLGGPPNMSFVPTEGVDIFTENDLKTDGSVLSYGQNTSAAEYGVDSATLHSARGPPRRCTTGSMRRSARARPPRRTTCSRSAVETRGDGTAHMFVCLPWSMAMCSEVPGQVRVMIFSRGFTTRRAES